MVFFDHNDMKHIFTCELSKNIYLNNYIFRLFIFCSIVLCEKGYSQNCLDKINRYQLYSGSDEIINGRKWIYNKKFLGSPLLFEYTWPEAELLYNCALYSGIVMNYNLLKNELIINHSENGNEKYIVLSVDKLSGFTLTDNVWKKKHTYEYIELPGTNGKALYENVSTGRLSFYIKPVKTIDVRSTDGQARYSDSFEYYVDTGSGFSGFRSKRELLKLLAVHGTEINRFIRKNNFKINNRQPGNVIATLNYFVGLN